MAFDRKQKGDSGEDLAARHLESKGYRVLARNFRLRTGEIDIICEHKGTVVFVEVKTRHSARFGPPQAAVTVAKQKKLTLAALEYLARTNQTGKPARFDVVAIDRTGPRPRIEIIQNAFNAAYG